MAQAFTVSSVEKRALLFDLCTFVFLASAFASMTETGPRSIAEAESAERTKAADCRKVSNEQSSQCRTISSSSFLSLTSI